MAVHPNLEAGLVPKPLCAMAQETLNGGVGSADRGFLPRDGGEIDIPRF
jgi:hypothetical protein